MNSRNIQSIAGLSQYQTHLALLQSYCCESLEPVLSQLNRAIDYATKSSPFYRNDSRWHPVTTLSEIHHLPYTTKDDVKDAYPFGFLAVEQAQLTRYAESTGTSGRYSSGYVTRQDWLNNNIEVSLSWASILTPEDVLAIVVPYELTYVGADIDRVAELLNVSVISVGTNNKLCPWPRLIKLIESHKVSTLFCSPTRAIRLAQLVEDAGGDAKCMSVNKVICVGEPCSQAKRNYISECWGATVYNHYGMTEAMAVATPCREQKMHLCEKHLFAEVINVQTGQPVTDESEAGELVLTSLNIQAMPLIRYNTGDLVYLHDKPCACGNPCRTIEHLGRVNDTFEAPSGTHYFFELDEILFKVDHIEPYFCYAYDDAKLSVSVVQLSPEQDNSGLIKQQIQSLIKAKFNLVVNIQIENKKQWLHGIDNRSKPGTALSEAEREQFSSIIE